MNFVEQELLKKQLAPNYVGMGLYMNPNPNSPIKSADKLNSFSSNLRLSDFCKTFISEEGFELSPIDFVWEYTIKFNRKSGFMVMREYGSKVKLWVYIHNDDLNPEIFILDGFETKNFNRIITFIKSKRQALR